MKLVTLRVCNFQSFGPIPIQIAFDELTFLIGHNGTGKSAVLQALCRLFAFDPNLRRIQRSDFHVAHDEKEDAPVERSLWIEAEFQFPAIKEGEHDTSLPPFFAHMRLDDSDTVPRIRIRLDATLDAEGDIDDELNYVLDVDDKEEPATKQTVPKSDRSSIHVHYLPARRDPSDHVSYAATSVLGRILRSVSWEKERPAIEELAGQLDSALFQNDGVSKVGERLSGVWQNLHRGKFFASPKLTFSVGDLESLLRHLSVSFTPGHDEEQVDFSRLSDGQRSLMYLSLVLATQEINRKVLSGDLNTFDLTKLRPPIFTLVAMEEPENSLSPHYLGRIISSLQSLADSNDGQAVVATHAPSLLRRIGPGQVRHFRLNASRCTEVASIALPPEEEEAHKFVREAVQAFPELYFARVVVLGEGDSEEIVVPRALNALRLGPDGATITVAPLGGRHVNHFWRLLEGLKIPFFTLLDLDRGRHDGGWGRIRYALKQLRKIRGNDCGISEADIEALPKWNDATDTKQLTVWLDRLEKHGVFFSSPLDLDFSMLSAFADAYKLTDEMRTTPTESEVKAVLGKSHSDVSQYSKEQQELFATYHRYFKLGSKPARHLLALAELTDLDLVEALPASLLGLAEAIRARLQELPD